MLSGTSDASDKLLSSKGVIYLIVRCYQILNFSNLVQRFLCSLIGLSRRHEEDIAIGKSDCSRTPTNLEQVYSKKRFREGPNRVSDLSNVSIHWFIGHGP